jgi:hypothetical protein
LTQADPQGVVVLPEQEMAQDGPLHVAVPVPDVGPGHAVQAALLPQPFCGLALSQLPPQSIWPAGHLHAPLWQVVPPVQEVVQLPQCDALLVVSTQLDPQSVGVELEQEMAQDVPVHVAAPLPAVGDGHAVPQTPPLAQPFCGPGSSQVPEQFTLPAGHLHSLFWQVMPPMHIVVQLPQYVALLVVSTQLDPQRVGSGDEQPVTHV